MRYKIIMVFILIVFVIVCFMGGMYIKKNTINMDFAEKGSLIFRYGDMDVAHSLYDQELLLIKSIFDGKILYRDNPSCGFTENISVILNDSYTFCFACDTCPVIYWKEENKYFRLTEKELEQLYQLLEEYGFHFPCI